MLATVPVKNLNCIRHQLMSMLFKSKWPPVRRTRRSPRLPCRSPLHYAMFVPLPKSAVSPYSKMDREPLVCNGGKGPSPPGLPVTAKETEQLENTAGAKNDEEREDAHLDERTSHRRGKMCLGKLHERDSQGLVAQAKGTVSRKLRHRRGVLSYVPRSDPQALQDLLGPLIRRHVRGQVLEREDHVGLESLIGYGGADENNMEEEPVGVGVADKRECWFEDVRAQVVPSFREKFKLPRSC